MGKDAINVQFTVTVISLRDLPKSLTEGYQFCVELKDGKRKEETYTEAPKPASANTINWEEKFLFTSKFTQPSEKKFEPKKEISLSIKQSSSGRGTSSKEAKPTTFGTVEVDLANYAADRTARYEFFPLKIKDKKMKDIAKKTNLAVRVESLWIKEGAEPLKPTPAPPESKKEEKKKAVQIDTHEDVTEPPSEENSAESSEEHSVATESSYSFKGGSSGKTSSTVKPVKDNEWQLIKEDLEAQIVDLQKDNQRLQKKVQTLTQKLEEKEQSSATTRVTSSQPVEDDSAELEDLRKRQNSP